MKPEERSVASAAPTCGGHSEYEREAVPASEPALSIRVHFNGESVPAGVTASEVRRCAVPGELVLTMERPP
jgi:hypothetical protein